MINFFSIDVDSINIEISKIGELKREKKLKHIKTSLHDQLLIYIVLYIIKRFQITIKNIKVSIPHLTIKNNFIEFIYERDPHFRLNLLIGESSFNITSKYYNLTVDTEPLKFSEYWLSDPILSLINFEAIIIPLDFTIPQLSASICNQKFIFNGLTIPINLPKGTVYFVIPDIVLKTDYKLFNGTAVFSDVSLFKSFEIKKVPQLQLDKMILTVKQVELTVGGRQFALLDNIKSGVVNKQFTFTINSVDVHYNTFIGQDLLQTFKVGGKNRRLDFFIPLMRGSINKVLFDLRLSDSCIVTFTSQKMKCDNRKVTAPYIKMYWEEELVGLLTEPLLMADDGMSLSGHTLRLDYPQTIKTKPYEQQIVYGWRAISPFVHKITYGETMPFPCHFALKLLRCNVPDKRLNSVLCASNAVLPSVLKDHVLRQILIQKRSQKLTESQKKEALDKLRGLAFRDYKKSFSEKTIKKLLFQINIHDPKVNLSSRDFPDMRAQVGIVDPGTPEVYPDLDWETLVGAWFSAECSVAEMRVMDCPKPLCYMTMFKCSGPVVIGEAKSPYKMTLSTTLFGQKVEFPYNSGFPNVYTDMTISCDQLYYYLGHCYTQIWRDVSDVMQSVVPQEPDPSTSLKWWDFWRAKARGIFRLEGKRVEVRYPATEVYTEMGEYMPLTLIDAHLTCKERNIILTADELRSHRQTKDVEGPLLFSLPNLTWTFKYDWTCKCGDTRQHIWYGKPGTFESTATDTWVQYRASELIMKESVCEFNDLGLQKPTIQLDIAHIDWFLKAVNCFTKQPKYLGEVREKYGARKDRRAPFLTLIYLGRFGHLDINTKNLTIRVFDHFPVKDGIKGTSIDIHMRHFSMKSFLNLGEPTKNTYDIHCDEVAFNATDLNRISDVDTGTPTFFVIKSLDVSKSDTIHAKVQSMAINVNQLFARYLKEYSSSVELVKKPPVKDENKAGSQSCTYFNLDQAKKAFTEVKGDVSIDSFKLVVESCHTDLFVSINLAEISGTMLSSELNETAYLLNIPKFDIDTNGRGNLKTVVSLGGASMMGAPPSYMINLPALRMDITPEDVAGLLEVIKEVSTGDENAVKNRSLQKTMNNSDTLVVSLRAPVCEANLYSDKPFSQLQLVNLRIDYAQHSDGTRDFSLAVHDISIINNSKDAFYRNVITQSENARSAVDQLYIALKLAPPVSGAIVVSQAELIFSPTAIYYETPFRDALVEFFNKNAPNRPYTGRHINLGDPSYQLPMVQYPPDIIPETEFLSKKSEKIQFEKTTAESTILFRYLHVNPITMTVSYRNPDSKLIPSISNFQGSLREISYHDVTSSIMGLIDRLSKDIALEMIPQFFRHVVGMKPEVGNEAKLEEWMRVNDSKMSVQDKQRMLLFGKAAARRKNQNNQ